MLSKCMDSGLPCGLNSSYSFPPVVLKLCRCFQHEMKMCMWFGYNTSIIFSHFFCFMNLVSFFDMKCCQSVWTVGILWVNSSYSFPPIVLKLCRCFLNGMKMCMRFWCNPLIFFYLYLSNFQALICLSPQIAL